MKLVIWLIKPLSNNDDHNYYGWNPACTGEGPNSGLELDLHSWWPLWITEVGYLLLRKEVTSTSSVTVMGVQMHTNGSKPLPSEGNYNTDMLIKLWILGV